MIYTQTLALVAVVVVRECIAAIKTQLMAAESRSCLLIKPDPAVTARIKAYTSKSMVERYGAYGPP